MALMTVTQKYATFAISSICSIAQECSDATKQGNVVTSFRRKICVCLETDIEPHNNHVSKGVARGGPGTPQSNVASHC